MQPLKNIKLNSDVFHDLHQRYQPHQAVPMDRTYGHRSYSRALVTAATQLDIDFRTAIAAERQPVKHRADAASKFHLRLLAVRFSSSAPRSAFWRIFLRRLENPGLLC
jgi:hypothetical protein